MSSTEIGGRIRKSFNQDGLRLRIDNIVFFDGLFYIRGWALEKDKPVKSIRVRATEGITQAGQFARTVFIVNARVGELRDDVAHAFKLDEESSFAGFEAAVEGLDIDQIVISIIGKGEAGDIEFTVGNKAQIKTADSEVSSGVLIMTEKPPGAAVRRYRADHLAEGLNKKGIRARVINLEYGYEPDLLDYRHLVLQRTEMPYYQYVADRFRKRGGRVFFEIDDALFSYDISIFNEHLRQYPAMRDLEVDRMADTVDHCDGIIASTDYLADAARTMFKNKPVYVNRNVANDRLLELSEAARNERDMTTEEGVVAGVFRKIKNVFKDSMNISQLVFEDDEDEEPGEEVIRIEKNRGDSVTIGYFSGSMTHDRDFAVISGVLADILEKHKNVRLLLAGKINIPVILDVWKERIDRVGSVDWTKLPALIRRADINLAPLMDIRFNRCKSVIKWLEAALVDVPTAAVRNDEFCSVIRDGETGFLCGDEEEWRTALEKLIEDKELRKRIGEAARLEVIENYTTDTINEELIKLFGAG